MLNNRTARDAVDSWMRMKGLTIPKNDMELFSYIEYAKLVRTLIDGNEEPFKTRVGACAYIRYVAVEHAGLNGS